MKYLKLCLTKKPALIVGLALLALLGAVLLLTPPQRFAAAQAPDGELDFAAASYVSAAGDSTIVSQQTILDQAYFEQAGVLDNLQITPNGLTLVEDVDTGAYVSGAIRSPLDFTTDIGPAWLAEIPEGTSVSIEVRLSDDGQSWGDWHGVPVEFYPIRNGEYGGTLIWVDQAEVYAQFKVTLTAEIGGPVPYFHYLSLHLNDTSQGPTTEAAAAKVQSQEKSLTCPAQPAIIWRSEWGCPPGQDSPRWPPAYQPVTHVVINHSATPNTSDDWAKVVRSIWNYHANVLGWGDVGYNYMIDPLGNIYEGRAGGDDVIGAFDAFNRGAMGIGYIGCYGECDYLGIPNADPTEAMLEAGNDLIAWKLGQKGLDPFGEGPYCEETLPTIVGRSEVTCRKPSLSPGSWLAATIPSMRTSVAERLATCQLANPPDIQSVTPNSGLVSEEVTLVIEGQNFKPNEAGFKVELVGPDGTRYSLNVMSGGTAIWFKATIPANLLPPDLYDVVVTNPDGQADTLVDAYEAWQDADPAPVIDSVTPASGLVSEAVTLTVKGQNFKPNEAGFKVELRADDGTTYQLQLGATKTITKVEAIIAANQTPAGLYDLVVTNPDGQTATLVDAYEAWEDAGGGPTVRVTPPSLQIGLGATGDTTIEAVEMTNLFGFEIELTYDTSVVNVVDADATTEGVQVGLGTFFDGVNFTVTKNEVVDGVIRFVATRQAPASGVTGTTTLLKVTWQGKSPGETALTLSKIKLSNPDGQAITATVENGQIQVKSGVIVRGRIELQSRDDHSGVTVQMGERQTQTGSDGQFALEMTPGDSYHLTLTAPGYLTAQAEGQMPSGTTEVDLGEVTLPGGDVTNDNEIDIFDLALIGGRYGSNDPVADINGDGLVDIFDLSLAASNYGQHGPMIMGLDAQLRSALDAAGMSEFKPDVEPDPAKVALGQLLFF